MEIRNTRGAVLEKLRRVARAQGQTTLSRAEFMRRSGISGAVLLRLFPSWKAAVTAAGLVPRGRRFSSFEGQLLAELARICERLGRFPNAEEYRRRSGRDPGLLRRPFGYWWQMPQRLLDWLEEREPRGPAAEIARRETASLWASLAGRRRPRRRRRRLPETLAALWEQHGGLRYGPPLDLPSLRHEPTSEMGVVFVFGMLCEKMGFVVDAIHPHFPDCEAKRRVEGQPNHWEPVRIEFELRSSGFRNQGHRAHLCDLIVCWVHDWPDCPLEVIALKNLVATGRAERKDEHTPATQDHHPAQERLARELL